MVLKILINPLQYRGQNASIALRKEKSSMENTAFIAEGAIVQGNVTIGEDSGIWFHAVVRTEGERIVIGGGTNIQDHCVLHTDAGAELSIGNGVTVGHGAIIHGCTIEDHTLIGMGAIILNHAHIGKNCMIGAGAVVTEGMEIPDGSVAVGCPARVIRTVTEEEKQHILDNARHYVEVIAEYTKASSIEKNRAEETMPTGQLEPTGRFERTKQVRSSTIEISQQEGEQEAVEKRERIEKSLRKKFHKELFSRFAKAINTYELIQENDHIAVCISGGKDSMLMAKLFQELKCHNKFDFQLTFLVMDPGYSSENRRQIEQNAQLMGVPIVLYESDIFDAVDTVEKSPCYLCARMRRGHLYKKAQQLGCNKIALGHHYDDVIETILMGMLYGAQMQTMMPKLHSTNFEGMELIRPMYLIREEDIKRWCVYNDLHFLQCACHFTENCSSVREDGSSSSKRMEIKKLISDLKKVNPFVEANIFKSVENVNLDTVIAYKKSGMKHHFLDAYAFEIKENDKGTKSGSECTDEA